MQELIIKKAKNNIEKGDLQDIAKQFNVSKSLVYKVSTGKRKNHKILNAIIEKGLTRAAEIEKTIQENN